MRRDASLPHGGTARETPRSHARHGAAARRGGGQQLARVAAAARRRLLRDQLERRRGLQRVEEAVRGRCRLAGAGSPRVLGGHAAGLRVALEPVPRAAARQLALHVLLERVLLALGEVLVQHDQERADREREQARADELVEPARGADVAPRGDVVGQPAGADEEQAEHEEHDAQVQHAHRADDLVVGGRRAARAATLQRALAAVRRRDAGLGALQRVAALARALLLGAPLALAPDGQRRVQPHRVHPAKARAVRRAAAAAAAAPRRDARASLWGESPRACVRAGVYEHLLVRGYSVLLRTTRRSMTPS